MFGNILGAAAGPLLSGLFGDEKTEQFLGHTDNGWQADITSAFSQRPSGPDDNFTNWPSPLREEPPEAVSQSFFDKADEFLGSNPGKLASGVAAGFIDDARQRRNSRKHRSDLMGEGLTPYEIAGSGGSGPVQSQGSTLGSGPATQMTQQQAFTASENQKERDNKLAIAELQNRPAQSQADTARLRYELERVLTPSKMFQIDAQSKLTRTQAERAQFELDNFWPIKFASMGPDNIMMAIATFNQGVDVKRLLMDSGTGMTAAERKNLDELFRVMASIKSAIGTGSIALGHITKFFQRGDRWLDPKDNVLGQYNDLWDMQDATRKQLKVNRRRDERLRSIGEDAGRSMAR